VSLELIRATAEIGRLDVVAAKIAGVSRALMQTWVQSGAVLVNGKPVIKGSFYLKGGESLEIQPVPEAPSDVLPENIPLTVLFEDEHIIAIDKPAGMLVHPASGVYSGTLVNALLGRVPLALEGDDFGPEGYRPGIVHRLDQDTSGVMVVAKTRAAHASLSTAFANRTTKKIYLAITVGVPSEQVRVDAPVGRHPVARVKMSVGGTNARDARTDFLVLRTAPLEKPKFALVQCQIYTGRTHQIRVHLQHIKTPVLGDTVYGKTSSLIDRQALHAWRLEIHHPVTHELIKLECGPPEDFVNAWLGVGGVWNNPGAES
jgi:23S rRNA pseudouridine1911/1915/1917 synthase